MFEIVLYSIAKKSCLRNGGVGIYFQTMLTENKLFINWNENCNLLATDIIRIIIENVQGKICQDLKRMSQNLIIVAFNAAITEQEAATEYFSNALNITE